MLPPAYPTDHTGMSQKVHAASTVAMTLRNEEPYAALSIDSEKPSNRRERKYAKRKREILRATAMVLAEQGYHGTSLDMIAERLDMAKASLYYYFASKDVVIHECLATCATYVANRLRKVAEEPNNPREKLQKLILEQLTITTIDFPEISRLFLYPLDWNPDFAAEVRASQNEHNQIFRGVIDEGLRKGEFSVADVTVATVCLHGAMNQVPRWLSGRRRLRPLREDLDLLAATIMRLFVVPSA